MRWLGLGLTVAFLAVAVPASAQETSSETPQLTLDRQYVPPGVEVSSDTYWLLGVTFERTISERLDGDILGDQLFGLYLGRRFDWLHLSLRIMTSMNYDEGLESMRFVFATTNGVKFEVLGLEFMYGIGAHFEIRLDDHYWLLLGTPAQLSVSLWRGGSWNIQLTGGIRFVLAGALIDSFIIDPNGIDNDAASAELDDIKDDLYDGFMGLTFSREID